MAPAGQERPLPRRLLLVTATTSEAAAVLAALAPAGPVGIGPYEAAQAGPVTVLAGGIGPAAAAAATATALALHPQVDVVVNVGIAGGFAGSGAGVGSLVLATESAFGDLGADSPEGFLDSASLDWGPAGTPADPALVADLAERLRAGGLAVATGLVLTVSTVTGTAARGLELFAASAPVAEAMEGAAVGAVAARFGRPFLELRAVSNLVGERNRAEWDVPAAARALTAGLVLAVPALVAA